MKKIIMAAALIWVINLNVHAWQKAVDAVVAQDGTGDYTSLIDAVNAIPFHHEGQYIVYVKAGTYRGHVHIPRSLTRISIIGDGMDQVFITDNQVSGGPKAVPVERAATVVDLANDTYCNARSDNRFLVDIGYNTSHPLILRHGTLNDEEQQGKT